MSALGKSRHLSTAFYCNKHRPTDELRRNQPGVVSWRRPASQVSSMTPTIYSLTCLSGFSHKFLNHRWVMECFGLAHFLFLLSPTPAQLLSFCAEKRVRFTGKLTDILCSVILCCWHILHNVLSTVPLVGTAPHTCAFLLLLSYWKVQHNAHIDLLTC